MSIALNPMVDLGLETGSAKELSATKFFSHLLNTNPQSGQISEEPLSCGWRTY
ncbi:MAG: hypothetical protein AB8B95_10320 [Pseudohongiellaceae bacterium]